MEKLKTLYFLPGTTHHLESQASHQQSSSINQTMMNKKSDIFQIKVVFARNGRTNLVFNHAYI
jgi:hypothetical protein